VTLVARAIGAAMIWRALFLLYIPTLFVLTHWPKLHIEAPIRRPDLVVHLGAFGTWSALLLLSGLAGARGRTATIGRAWLIAALYASFDEATQAIPVIRRTAAWDDWAFNLMGVTLGCLAVALAWAVARRSAPADVAAVS
jgi:VanZ family protein